MTDKDNIEYWLNEVHQGDVRETLKEIPDESVDMVVTSPPYYGLRNYQEDEQIGLEETPYEFIQNLVDVSDEIYRVLKPSGSFYLNLGDTYAGGGGISGVPDDWDSASTQDREKYPDSVPARDVEFPDKCKMLIPHRVAISLIDNGWICRNDIVWSKPNPMPESVTDRRSTKFEYVFHFVKQQDYYYDLDSIREPYSESSIQRVNQNNGNPKFNGRRDRGHPEGKDTLNPNQFVREDGKNPGDIQEVTTANHSEAHFAVFPQDLIEPHIKSSCPEDGVVLDPFIGSGTTAVVAEQLGRDWIGIDLSKDYVEMSYDRIDDETKLIFDERSVFDY